MKKKFLIFEEKNSKSFEFSRFLFKTTQNFSNFNYFKNLSSYSQNL